MPLIKHSSTLLCQSKNLIAKRHIVILRNPQCLLSNSSSSNITTSNNDEKDASHLPNNSKNKQRSSRETTIQTIGNKTDYDAVKQLRLVELPDNLHPQPNILASMHVKRNIIFGTRIHDREYLQIKGQKDIILEQEEEEGEEENTYYDDTHNYRNYHNFGFVKVCKPLLKACLDQAGVEGDQPQGLAALSGLSARVKYLIDNPSDSKIMEDFIKQASSDNNKKIIFDATTAIATQTPRQGHETVGLGTYLDARPLWTALAKEYALSRKGEMIKQGESQLFSASGAVFVGIEYIGDENPNYWIDAGGSMARFFFV